MTPMKRMPVAVLFVAFVAPALAFADGMADFNANCLKCHGGSAKTNMRRAIMLKVDPNKMYLPASEMDKARMTEMVEKGKDRMPAFAGKLTKEQIAGIVDYVKSLKKN
jgi:mono/diheme cytochrome c family protein